MRWFVNRELLPTFLVAEMTIIGLAVVPDGVDLNDIILISVLPTLLAILFAAEYGSPKNWWARWFGVEITIDPNKHAKVRGPDEVATELPREVAVWVGEVIKGPYLCINPYRYKFLHKRDAAVFKLTWA